MVTDATSPVRPAEPADVPAILRLVRELAVYEHEPDAVAATEEDFRQALFPAQGSPTAYAHVARSGGEVVGMALWYLTFSTWTGRPGIWLEDLFVRPQQRGSGLGTQLLQALAQLCVARGYPRLEWWVLDWNESSIGFYRSLGAVPQDEWTVFRMDGEPLARLGGQH